MWSLFVKYTTKIYKTFITRFFVVVFLDIIIIIIYFLMAVWTTPITGVNCENWQVEKL